MESTPTVSSESWTRYFYLSSWDCLGEWSRNPSHISSLFLCWEWSNLTWFPTWKPRRGGSALSCNIDQQALITIITQYWVTCYEHVTPMCASTVLSILRTKGLTLFLLFCMYILNLLFLIESACCLFHHNWGLRTSINMLGFIIFKHFKGLSHQWSYSSFQKHY